MAFTYGKYPFNGGGTQFDDFAFYWNGGADTNPTTSPNTTPSWHQDSTGGGSTNGAADTGDDSDGFLYVETSGSPAIGQTGEVELDINLDASSNNITVDFFTNGGDVSNRCIWRVQTNEDGGGWVTQFTFTYDGNNNEAQDVWTEHNVDLTGDISDASTRIRIQVELDQSGGAGLYELDPSLDGITITGVDAVGISSVDSDYGDASDEFDFDENSLDINGQGFGATIGASDVYLSNNDLLSETGEIDITAAVNTWSDTVINLDFADLGQSTIDSLHTLGPGARFVIVNVGGVPGTTEYFLPVTMHRPKAFALSLSDNIAVSGENTTAVMTPPDTKTTGDFGGGRIQDDENPGDTVDIGEDEYREDEWSIEATRHVTLDGLGAVDGETYQFRVLIDGVVADTITVTPELTISDVVAPNITNAGDELFELTETNIVMTGTDFGAAETGSAKVELVNNVVYASGTKATQSIDTWSATSIQFDLVIGSLTEIDLWLYVTDSIGTVSIGYPVQVYRTPTITNIEDEIFSSDENGIVLDGTYMQSPQGTGKLEISDNAVYATGTKVLQTINTWADDEINFDLEIGSVGQETMWMWVTNDLGRRSTSTQVTITGLPISTGFWKTSSIQGAITSGGFNTTIFLIRDEG